VKNTQHVRCESAGLTSDQNKLLWTARKERATEQCGAMLTAIYEDFWVREGRTKSLCKMW
jgi:hypothetical protein